MPFELGLGKIGDEVILELAGGFEVTGAAMGALLGTDIMFNEGGAGRGLGSEGAGVPAVFLASAVGARSRDLVAAREGALTALPDVLQLVLDQRQSPAQVGVLRLQVGDPSLERSNMGQDGGLGLARDCVPQRCGDRRSSNHTPITMRSYRRFDLGMPPEPRSRGEALNSYWSSSADGTCRIAASQ